MYRLTTYKDGQKFVDEFKDEDELRREVGESLSSVEDREIKAFSVSWIAEKAYHETPFWEKKGKTNAL